MDCLQCVRSKQWVGAVPLSLVMGGEPPTRPDGEEDESSLTARLTWPHRIQSQRRPIAGKDEPGHHFSLDPVLISLFNVDLVHYEHTNIQRTEI